MKRWILIAMILISGSYYVSNGEHHQSAVKNDLRTPANLNEKPAPLPTMPGMQFSIEVSRQLQVIGHQRFALMALQRKIQQCQKHQSQESNEVMAEMVDYFGRAENETVGLIETVREYTVVGNAAEEQRELLMSLEAYRQDLAAAEKEEYNTFSYADKRLSQVIAKAKAIRSVKMNL